MTEKTKAYIERWMFVWIIGFVVACLVALQYSKSDKAELVDIKKTLDKTCEKQDDMNDQFNKTNIEINNKLTRVITILEERQK